MFVFVVTLFVLFTWSVLNSLLFNLQISGLNAIRFVSIALHELQLLIVVNMVRVQHVEEIVKLLREVGGRLLVLDKVLHLSLPFVLAATARELGPPRSSADRLDHEQASTYLDVDRLVDSLV